MVNNCVGQREDYPDGVPVDRVGLKIVDGKYVVGDPPEPKDPVPDLAGGVRDCCSGALEMED